MRINRLDLTRYGKFTDHVVDFGPRPEGAGDLHIVYGPNEAGKSTLFNAWLDLLFGIGAQSSYNFLHPYPAMRIGAAIEFDGKLRQFVRIKRQQNSLLDERDQPVAETALLASLGGLDRDSYQTMFSLDDETLEQGGESILASRGDLGELLFAASAGLGELSQRLAEIRGLTEDFYKPRAQKRRLGELKAELADLKAERERIDTQASRYAQLTRDRDEAAKRLDEAQERRRGLRTRLAEIGRLLSARPRLLELDRLHTQLEPLASLPAVSQDWRQQVRDLGHEDAGLEAARAAIADEIARLTADLESVHVDEAILSCRDRLAELDKLRTRHDAAEEDLPERRTARGRLDGQVEQTLARLGRPDADGADRLLLDTARTASLRQLIDERSALDIRLASARKEAADASAAYNDTLEHLQAAGGAGDHTTMEQRSIHVAALSELVAELRRDDHALRRQAAMRALPEARDEAGRRLAALSPWQGDIEELHSMSPPSADRVREWKSAMDSLGRDRAAQDETIGRLTETLARLQAEASALRTTRALPSTESVDALRTARNEAWQAHKSALDRKSAEDFEQKMQAHDEAADKRALHQADAARLSEIEIQLAVTASELAAAESRKTALASRLDDLKHQISDAVSALSATLPRDMTPDALETWLARRDLAIEADNSLRLLMNQLEMAERDRRTATERLLRALSPLIPEARQDSDYEDLLGRAQLLISQETKLDGWRQALSEQDRTLKRRKRELQAAEDEAAAWMLAWKQACTDSWLGDNDRVPTAAEVREALPLLGELAAALHDRSSLADRITKMERDQADYRAMVVGIANAVDLDAEAAPPAILARQLSDRMAAAERALGRREDLSRQIAEAEARQRRNTEARTAISTRISRMLDALSADTLSDAALRIDQALEKRQVELRIGQTEAEIIETLDVDTIDAARTLLDGQDATALADEKLELEAGLEALDGEIQELSVSHAEARNAVDTVGGDDAVARIEQQRRTTLLAIAEGAEQYMRLSAGVVAMEQALAVYRDRHSSSMMQRASEAIRTISRNRYTGLTSQPDKGRELLIALQNDGSSKQAAEMSKGARFQLYLALRVAGYHEFAATRQPVPFIADDIMETFDDFRAEETFRLFAGMADIGQVIYLTHHRHLCDIARSVCPDVKVHEITS